MSYLSTALNRVAARNQIKQADIARAAGLTRSQLSRVFTGEQRSLSDDDFIALLTAFPDRSDRAALIAARCMDARVGPGSELVEIRVTETAAAPLSPAIVELSPEAEKAFAWLRSQCPLNVELEKHLIGFARLTGMK